MIREATLEDILNVRRGNEEQDKQKPFLFLRDGDTVDIEIVDNTFSYVTKGELGLDGKPADWPQYQIQVIDCNDNRVKTFKPNKNCVTKMWDTIEGKKIDPLHFKGQVFKITREGRQHIAQIVSGGATVIDDDLEDGVSSSVEQSVRDAVKSVLASNKGKIIKSKELRQWVAAYLDDLGIKANTDEIIDIIEEEKEKE